MEKKLKHKDRKKEEIELEKYENTKTLFTISFIISDSLFIFDLVFNFVYKEIDEYFFLRFLVVLFGLYGTFILVGGYYLSEYCDCECSCDCGKILNSILSIFGCSFLLGGLLLLISYCIELVSIKYYFKNKSQITDSSVVTMMYLVFLFSTTTMILFIFLTINKKNEKKVKYKAD